MATLAHPELAELDTALEERYGPLFEQQEARAMVLARDAFPELQRVADRETVHFLGGIAIRGEQETTVLPEAQNETSLMAATQMAAIGDEQARSMIATNVATDLSERLFKAGNQTRVSMQVVNGRIEQNGRSLLDIHRNTLSQTVLVPQMMRRARYESGNVMLVTQLHSRGVLQEYDVAVMSPSPTDMTIEEKKEYGLFVDTESCSIQYITAQEDDLTLETAFVAGKVTPDSERHDLEAIQRLAANRGLEVDTSDGSDVLQYVLLIPKGEVRGVEDIVRWYDDAAGGTFYGQNLPRQDYRRFAQMCLERGASFGNIVDSITEQLIAEAHTFRVPLDANMRLNELSGQYGVERAVHDRTIDAAIFGEEAARHIEDARFFADRGDFDRAQVSLTKAQETEDSNSCPLFKGEESSSGGNGPDKGSSGENQGEKKWGSCPYCKAKVFVDPCAARISCWDCTALVVNGKIISKGNGGTNRRMSDNSKHAAQAKQAQLAKDEAAQDSTFEEEHRTLLAESQDTQRTVSAAGSLATASA